MQNNNDINDLLDHPVGQLRKSPKFWDKHPSADMPWPSSSVRRLDYKEAMPPLLEPPTPVVWPKDKPWPAVPTGMTLPPTGGWAALFQSQIDAVSMIESDKAPTKGAGNGR